MVQQLAGKVAYVTGAASGIGKAIADLYAQQGAKVVIADLKQEAAEAAAKDIESKGGTAREWQLMSRRKTRSMPPWKPLSRPMVGSISW